MTVLNLWHHLDTEQRSRSSSVFRRMCRAEFLNHVRVREWQDLVRQLRQVANDLGLRRNREAASADQVHRALLAGLLSHVGMYDRTTRDHIGARQAHFTIARGSVLHRKSPAWVMAGELVETNRMWARMVARIDPSWIEPAAEHLVRRSYGDPTWDGRRGSAMTTERVTLYGLPIVEGRRVQLGRVDAALARTLFIEHALVDGDWRTHHAFVAANRGAGRRGRAARGAHPAARPARHPRPAGRRSSTPGCPTTSRPPAISTAGGREPVAPSPTSSRSRGTTCSTPTRARSTSMRSPPRGTRATWRST